MANSTQIAAFADQIVTLLGPLWEDSGDATLQNQRVLCTLSALIASLKAKSPKYYTVIIPLIDKSVGFKGFLRPGMEEEALELWLVVLEEAPAPASSELISLTRYAMTGEFPLNSQY